MRPAFTLGPLISILPSIHANALALNHAMVKEAKFFRKQAAKAERMARTVADAEISERYLNMAKDRSQANVLKAKKKPRLKSKKKLSKKRR
jgi:hypothetical protein